MFDLAGLDNPLPPPPPTIVPGLGLPPAPPNGSGDEDEEDEDSGSALEVMPVKMQRRVHALKVLHEERSTHMAAYRSERVALERKYKELVAPLSMRRAAIVSGTEEPPFPEGVANTEEMLAKEAKSSTLLDDAFCK